MIERARHSGHRIRQTVTAFGNGPQILGALLGRRILGRPEELTFALQGGGTVTCPNRPGARVPVYEVFAEDAYRLSWFTDDLGPDLAALDIGGHIGCFSLAFARLHPEAQVHAYEASPTTATFLARNISDNALGARVHSHAQAVSSERGTLEFADNVQGSALNGLTAPEGAATVQIEEITFADAVAAAGGRVDVVKIDTEGAEYDIVLGSKPADWDGVRRVVLEYHDVPGHGWSELEAFFGEAGLKTVLHEPVTAAQGTAWLRRSA